MPKYIRYKTNACTQRPKACLNTAFTILCIWGWWYLTGKVRSVAINSYQAYDPNTGRPDSAVLLPEGSSLYANLKISGRQIRLLTILSTEPEISCRLEVAELKGELSFNALSYVWGDPRVTKAILVNGHRILVTINLVSALEYAPYHLRKSKHATSKKLWVDAICINQEDIAEKSRQVSLMKHIYSQSDIVLCWLG
ncbi:hypothetical protein V2G26_013104 [Clonostachys chloroleuca]